MKEVNTMRKNKNEHDVSGISDGRTLSVAPAASKSRPHEKNTTNNRLIFIAAISILLAISMLPSASLADEKNVTFTLKLYIPNSVVITIQPSLRTAVAGTSVTYTAKIENPNPVQLAMSLDLGLPAGFTGDITDSVNIPASGSKTVTFTVKSDVGTATGSYKVGVNAATDDQSFTGHATASYNVDVYADADVDIEPQTQTGLPGQTLHYTVTVKNKDPAGFDSRTFSVSPLLPKDWKGKLTYNGRTDTTASAKINASSYVELTYDVTSPTTAKKSVQIGVNVTSNKMSTEGYAGYDITLCGDGVCDPEEASVCAADCGQEPRFACSGRCEETVDDGVHFSASADFNMLKFAICKRTATIQQCKAALQGGCGINKNCICGKSGGLTSTLADCGAACVDTDGTYYIYGEGVGEAVRSVYNYSFECPFVNMTEINGIKADYSSALTDFKKAQSTLTEAMKLNPLDRLNMQPCLDAHSIIVNEMDSYVKFLENVIKRPAISNTTTARSLADIISSHTGSILSEFCSVGSTGLLDIKSI